jgi:hypothetical protein
MNAKFKALAPALFSLLFAACPVMEPPEPVKLFGILTISNSFSSWTMRKVIAIDSKGAVVGETVPVDDGTIWTWQMPAVIEDGEEGIFWVEMIESAGQPVYYNEGTPEKFEADNGIVLNVTEKYIPVKTSADLRKLGKDSAHPRDESYVLIRNIRLGGDWEPLCKSGAESFSGGLYGRGHTVSGLKLTDTGNFQYVGLFGYLDNARIRDLNLVISNTELSLSAASQQGVGALAGFARDTTIEQVVVSGPSKGLKVNKTGGGDFYVGGIAGRIEGGSSISRSAVRFSITVEADSAGAGYLGGIAGYAEQTAAGIISISNCYNTDSMDLSMDGTNAFAGGILGYHKAAPGSTAESLIAQCYTTGNVSASVKGTVPAGTVAAGGLAGGSDILALGGLAGTRSCALMTTVSASSPNAALTSAGGLSGLGLVPTGTASCFQLDTLTITSPSSSSVNAAGTVSKTSNSFFISPPLSWDFSAIWKWDGQAGYPVFR